MGALYVKTNTLTLLIRKYIITIGVIVYYLILYKYSALLIDFYIYSLFYNLFINTITLAGVYYTILFLNRRQL